MSSIKSIIGDSFVYSTVSGSMDKTTRNLALGINKIGKENNKQKVQAPK